MLALCIIGVARILVALAALGALVNCDPYDVHELEFVEFEVGPDAIEEDLDAEMQHSAVRKDGYILEISDDVRVVF